MNTRPPLPPFNQETAKEKVQLAENGWNSREPEKVASAYTIDCEWRNRAEIFSGREKIIEFLTKKWEKELFKGIELKSKTVGLIGCGNIGSEVAKIARSLQMNVMVYDPYLSVDRIESLDAEKSSLEIIPLLTLRSI